MAITIRNKQTEELIRRIGRRTGEGPSAVVARLVAAEAKDDLAGTVPDGEVGRRIAAFENLAAEYPPPDPKPGWKEIEREVDALYDYLDKDYARGSEVDRRN